MWLLFCFLQCGLFLTKNDILSYYAAMEKNQLIEKAMAGFKLLDVDEGVKEAALNWIDVWLTDDAYSAYVPQINHLIESGNWEFLLDSFYQIIPFGTGGRRGLTGIGPNRINIWTIQSSAQGHSQYLIKQHGEAAKERGVVLAYDVRVYSQKGIYDDTLENPVMNLDCRQLAVSAAEVYSANGIRTFLFDGVRSTPELSFSIRHLNAIAGDMFSASHNLPTDNGKKVYDEFGGQLIPPHDQALVDEVTQNTGTIKVMAFDQAKKNGLIQTIGKDVDTAYHKQVSALSLSSERGVKIIYSPLHGTGLTSVYPVLKGMGFDVTLDPETANLSGAFENVTFNIPNPEVFESFDTSLPVADTLKADVILSTDPDADRIGVMALHAGKWCFLNGNEIGVVLINYAIEKYREKGILNKACTVIKTDMTTSLIAGMARRNEIQCIGDLLTGFKYIADEMNSLEKKGTMDGFILGTEESHGYIMGNYCRDKDAAPAAIWISELAAELKKKKLTLIDYLSAIYSEYGYCHNYLTEIRLLGARGKEQILMIMEHLRSTDIQAFGNFFVFKKVDRWQGEPSPHLSKTDTSSRNVLVYYFDNPVDDSAQTQSIKVTVRPSGTEPKIKMYFEVFGKPCDPAGLDSQKKEVVQIRETLEKAFMSYCYQLLGVDFPNRGFLLFWQLPLNDKLRYFEMEESIADLKTVENPILRKEKLRALLGFLGANPVEKVDRAYRKKYGKGILDHLELIDVQAE